MTTLLAAARSRAGRAVAALAGLGAVALILRSLGVATVETALRGGAPYLPILLALELAILACSTLALRALYGDAAGARAAAASSHAPR